MSDHGLGRADGNLKSAVAKDFFDGEGFARIVQRRRSAVRVNVINLVNRDPGIAHRLLHHERRANRLRIGRGEMVRVRVGGIPQNLGVDFRAAGERVFQAFQDEDASAFADDKAIAVLVERTARMFGIVVASGHGAHDAERGKHNIRNNRVRAAAKHHIRITIANQLRGLAQRVRARRAGRHDGRIVSARAMSCGQVK